MKPRRVCGTCGWLRETTIAEMADTHVACGAPVYGSIPSNRIVRRWPLNVVERQRLVQFKPPTVMTECPAWREI